jgi:NAD(P)H dehydrogenase (quinone)
VVEADYDRPETLAPALAGVERLLLVSSSEVGKRAPQHRAVIEAARAARVAILAYTSILNADSSPMILAGEHRETEAMLASYPGAVVLLRNGWYLENYSGDVAAALAHGAVAGASGEGRISAAARSDFADAAATVLRDPPALSVTHELAGDVSFTRAELAAEIARQTGREIAFANMSETEFTALLVKAGLPEGFAAVVADADAAAGKGALFSDSTALSTLAGHPTKTLDAAVREALAAAV